MGAASAEFAETLARANVTAAVLAGSEQVQRALARRNTEALAGIAERRENVTFLQDGAVVAGRERPLSAQARAAVQVGDRAVGQVAVAIALDPAMLERLGERLRLSQDDVLILTHEGEIAAATRPLRGEAVVPPGRPTELHLDGSTYRAVASRLPGPPEATLIAARPLADIEQAAADERRRIGLSLLLTLAAVGMVGYATAPAIARGRVALQQRALATRVLANVGDGVFLLDGSGAIRFWNRAAEAITGLPAERVWGRGVEEVIPQWRTLAPRIPVSPPAGEREEAALVETVPVDFGGKEAWLSIAGVELPEGTVYTFRDVTAERRLEEAKTEFVATVSHELRTPLAAIYGAAMTLAREDLGADAALRKELLETISEQADRLAYIVEEILVTSQLAAGELRLLHDRFDPVELARDVVQSTRLRLPENLAIRLTAPDSVRLASGDETRARQVLGNLVDNAVKYSPDGGRIDVEVSEDDGYVRFDVRDEGLGIPAAEQERIFEKFYRLDPNLRRGTGGTGLGLYISRELVRRMDGRMWVSSQPGLGSTFTFELPVADRDGESSG